MNKQQKVLASIGMAFCISGLVFAFMELLNVVPHEPFPERVVFSLGWSVPLVKLLKSATLTAGAAFLAVLATNARNKLFMILEWGLIPWGVFSLFPSSSWILGARLVVFFATWVALYRMNLVNRQHIAGALGIEALSLGYLLGANSFHLLGAGLLCIYSWQGMQAPDPTTRAISRFWLWLNIPFGVLAAALTAIEVTK